MDPYSTIFGTSPSAPAITLPSPPPEVIPAINPVSTPIPDDSGATPAQAQTAAANTGKAAQAAQAGKAAQAAQAQVQQALSRDKSLMNAMPSTQAPPPPFISPTYQAIFGTNNAL